MGKARSQPSPPRKRPAKTSTSKQPTPKRRATKQPAAREAALPASSAPKDLGQVLDDVRRAPDVPLANKLTFLAHTVHLECAKRGIELETVKWSPDSTLVSCVLPAAGLDPSSDLLKFNDRIIELAEVCMVARFVYCDLFESFVATEPPLAERTIMLIARGELVERLITGTLDQEEFLAECEIFYNHCRIRLGPPR